MTSCKGIRLSRQASTVPHRGRDFGSWARSAFSSPHARQRLRSGNPIQSTQEDIHGDQQTFGPITEVHLALTSNSSFEDIVGILKQTLTVPELPGFKGCRRWLSGLERLIVEDIAMQGIG